MTALRVLIVSENISTCMGGESSLPYYYAKLLAKRGAEVWLACHERVEAEVRAAFPELEARMRFVRDTKAQGLAWKCSAPLPYRIRDLLVGQAIHVSTQIRVREIARELAREGKIDVVFEPSPITPKGLSFMYDIGVPVVIGPMCGGMAFPPAFEKLDSFAARQAVGVSRGLSQLLNQIVPGKLRADVLLVANQRTGEALPKGYRGRCIKLYESGVDLDMWSASDVGTKADNEPVRFVFSGRFVDWKGVQYLVPAFAKAVAEHPGCVLELVGSGELDAAMRAMVEQLGLKDSVHLHGWLSRPEAVKIMRNADVFVMPSLRECGGTAILEAMAMGKPVITTNWAGPAEYVNPACGVLVDPTSEQDFINGLAAAIVALARDPERRRSLGEGGKLRVLQDHLDWESKAERMLGILSDAALRPQAAGQKAREAKDAQSNGLHLANAS